MKPELFVLVEFLSADEGGRRSKIYLDKLINPHEEKTAKVSLVYYPNVSYENLIEGNEFEILEGVRVVGKGTVIGL